MYTKTGYTYNIKHTNTCKHIKKHIIRQEQSYNTHIHKTCMNIYIYIHKHIKVHRHKKNMNNYINKGYTETHTITNKKTHRKTNTNKKTYIHNYIYIHR